ncbi:MAG: hypothetical protein QG597_409 [Actinomycetota bacterium]|nr:hypothetical protein [Actinomycetota bacterium]
MLEGECGEATGSACGGMQRSVQQKQVRLSEDVVRSRVRGGGVREEQATAPAACGSLAHPTRSEARSHA